MLLILLSIITFELAILIYLETKRTHINLVPKGLTEVVKKSMKAYVVKDKMKPIVNDDYKAYKIENDI